MNEAEEREMDRALKLDQKKLEDLGAFDAQKCGSYDMHVEARLDEAMWWAHNATNGHITDKAMKRIEGLRGAAPAPPPVSALRGLTDKQIDDAISEGFAFYRRNDEDGPIVTLREALLSSFKRALAAALKAETE